MTRRFSPGQLLRLTAMAAGLVAFGPIVARAILVAPHAIFIDHRTRSGQVFLVNTGATPEEVDVTPHFGYPASDSAGNVYVRFFDDTVRDPRSAAAWIRAFPRRVTVLPGDRQVVRLLATPPAGLPDGEYWTRLVITSRGQRIATSGTDTSITAGVSLEVRTVIAVNYRKGNVQTGVTLDDLRLEATRDSLIVHVALGRTGNAAWLGAVRVTLADSASRTVRDWSNQVAVYDPVRRRLAFGLDALPAGTYRARVHVGTEREDIPREFLLTAAAIDRSVGVVIP